MDMGVCTRRSTLLDSNWTDSSSSRSLSATNHQHLNLDFSAPADPYVDWNPSYLDTLDSESCEGCCNLCHNDIPMKSLSTGSLQACYLKSLIVDIRIYISMDPLNRWCYFLSRRWYVAWCAKIDHLVLTLPRWLLYMLYWRSRIVLNLIRSSA